MPPERALSFEGAASAAPFDLPRRTARTAPRVGPETHCLWIHPTLPSDEIDPRSIAFASQNDTSGSARHDRARIRGDAAGRLAMVDCPMSVALAPPSFPTIDRRWSTRQILSGHPQLVPLAVPGVTELNRWSGRWPGRRRPSGRSEPRSSVPKVSFSLRRFSPTRLRSSRRSPLPLPCESLSTRVAAPLSSAFQPYERAAISLRWRLNGAFSQP